MLSPHHTALCQASWVKIEPISEQAGLLFYEELFALDPTLKARFTSPLSMQATKLMTMIKQAVALLSQPHAFNSAVQALGQRHANYGVKAKDYDTVGKALLRTLELGLGSSFTPEVKEAWAALYGEIASIMLEAQAVVETA